MKEQERIGKIHTAIYHQCQQRGYAAPVDVLMEIGVLPKQNMRSGDLGKFHIWNKYVPVISGNFP